MDSKEIEKTFEEYQRLYQKLMADIFFMRGDLEKLQTKTFFLIWFDIFLVLFFVASMLLKLK